jgi:hypothetical protein
LVVDERSSSIRPIGPAAAIQFPSPPSFVVQQQPLPLLQSAVLLEKDLHDGNNLMDGGVEYENLKS